MNLISGIDLSANALAAQKTRLDIVAQNIANAQTTRTAAGGPYQRQVVSFETQLVRSQGAAHSALQSVRVAQVTTDLRSRALTPALPPRPPQRISICHRFRWPRRRPHRPLTDQEACWTKPRLMHFVIGTCTSSTHQTPQKHSKLWPLPRGRL